MSDWINANVIPGAVELGLDTRGETGVQVYPLVSGVATAEITFPGLKDTLPGLGQTMEGIWLNMVCDDGAGNPVAFYIINNQIGGVGALPAPDPSAVVGSTAQAIYVPAGAEYHRKYFGLQEFRVIQVSGANAFLRVEATSQLVA